MVSFVGGSFGASSGLSDALAELAGGLAAGLLEDSLSFPEEQATIKAIIRTNDKSIDKLLLIP
jgi:hypothetical protein